MFKISKVAKIRNRYNQVPHLTQDTNGKVTNSQKTPQTRAKRSALSLFLYYTGPEVFRLYQKRHTNTSGKQDEKAHQCLKDIEILVENKMNWLINV